MGYDKKQLKEPMKPLYGFSGKRVELVRVITLPISFGTPQNPRTEDITFDVVYMLYPYNAIFGRGLLNTFEAALDLGYLCLKILATIGVISVFGRSRLRSWLQKCTFSKGRDKTISTNRIPSQERSFGRIQKSH
jgi:hypothetical protein